MDEILRVLNQASLFIQKYWRIVIGFVDGFPTWLRLTVHILFYVAIFVVLASHVMAVRSAFPNWKRIEGSNLTCSYFNGTGFSQCSKINVDIFNRSWDSGSWTFSVAGLAHKLGQYKSTSRFLLFLLSLIHIPLSILGAIEMAFRAIIGTLYAFAVSIVSRLVLLVLYLVNLILMPIWKIVDARLTVEQHCPNCYSTFSLPAYRCPSCGVIHKDLHPGKSGLFFSRCTCGAFLPCAIISGRPKLDTLCPECERPLVASNAKEHTLILLGGNKSGKTAFLSSFYKSYTVVANATNKAQIDVEPTADFAELDMIYDRGYTVQSSATSIQAYNFIHDFSGAQETLVIYDVPDEVLLEEEYFEKNPLNFAYADGFVILYDPCSERMVRVESQKLGEEVDPDTYSADTLEDIVVAFVQQFSKIASRSSSRVSNIPVAVVINKADMAYIRARVGDSAIRKFFMKNPAQFNNDMDVCRNLVCRSFLIKIGLSNAINNLESVFTNVQYFAASATGHVENGKPFMPQHVLDPFAWLADQGGVGQSSSLMKRVCDTVNGRPSEDASGLEKKYQKAAGLLSSHDFEAAEREFRSIDDYKDSAAIVANIPELRYQYAKQLFSEQNYDAALKAFLALKGYKDSSDCALDSLFEHAELCFSQGKYMQALSAYEKLGDYRGANKKVAETRYRIATQKIKSGDVKSAYTDLKTLGDYKDAPAMIRTLMPKLIKAGVRRNLQFGPTEWRVLSVDEKGFALLVTEGVMFLAPYHTAQAPVTWARSALRNYLNAKFLNYFSDAEKELIFQTRISTAKNPQYDTTGGEDSFDYVFLLSADEAKQLFADKMDRVPAGKTSGYWYWLRSPGASNQHAAIVESTGAISDVGNQVTNKEGGIRPAIWITL